jgi:hypothetical protein
MDIIILLILYFLSKKITSGKESTSVLSTKKVKAAALDIPEMGMAGYAD